MGLFFHKQQMQIADSILPLAAKQEILASRLPQLNTDRLFLKNGEVCSYIDKAILNVKVKKRITKHVGHSAPGLFKGTRIHTGFSKPNEYVETNFSKFVFNSKFIF